jgi:hypothetical protein
VIIATKSQGKTDFVKEFLQNNPQAKSTAVNEAWTGAGMKGTISHTVVSEARKQLGLIGAQRGKTRKAAKPKAASEMSKTASGPGKTMFVKEFLNDHPEGNASAVNEAWQAAGFEGTISTTLVNKMRAKLGLTGNLRAKSKTSKPSPTGKKRGRPRREITAAVNGKPVEQPRGHQSTVLDDMEADIDRLIFKAMAIGDLTEIEDTLRRTRRLLYAALDQG